MSKKKTKVSSNAVVSLREITRETVESILELEVTPRQEAFVATNAQSLAEALFSPEAWYRAIYADETPVGFAMLSVKPEVPCYYLWRFMIGAEYQGKGYGKRALELVIAHVRTLPGARELLLSYAPGKGNPRKFYQKLGFEETGEVDDDEIVMRLLL
ncbi:N-acetyltransferase [Reticulibacter mediterranei]|uniref:N-acetyltransferase n=1 Tax=Reticulibacter mediterranei TaxID=2778369 RepID=A0A8J3N913_9CHLR|nr:GNAT family N-acetyltransferase [Reticulibacter mediterranei]GHP00106.1 N-acetyltransferase [Reticulibacter mediterranei]